MAGNCFAMVAAFSKELPRKETQTESLISGIFRSDFPVIGLHTIKGYVHVMQLIISTGQVKNCSQFLAKKKFVVNKVSETTRLLQNQCYHVQTIACVNQQKIMRWNWKSKRVSANPFQPKEQNWNHMPFLFRINRSIFPQMQEQLPEFQMGSSSIQLPQLIIPNMKIFNDQNIKRW